MDNINMETETIKMKKSPKRKGRYLVLLIIISLVAGALGGFVTDRYFSSKTNTETNNNNATSEEVINVEINEAVTDIIKEASSSVVSIMADIQSTNIFGQTINQQASGTGFIITSDGLILTNRHVVSATDATYTVITSAGKKFTVTKVIRDTINDLAFLEIEASTLPVLELGNSSALEVGQTVVAIGNALGNYQNTVTKGIVSGLDRNIYAGGSFASQSEQLEGVIQTDASINPGNSGGPLLDLSGRVVGINTAVDSSGQLIGFALPIDDAKKAIDSVIAGGKILRPFLGIRYIPLTPEFASLNDLPSDHGILIYSDDVRISAVVEDSPAAEAKLRSGDIITQIDDYEIGKTSSFSKIMQNFDPQDEVILKVIREDNNFSLKIVLAEQ
ncbi:MAG: trypsin-like peptidase domain-containing protein [bacterium]